MIYFSLLQSSAYKHTAQLTNLAPPVLPIGSLSTPKELRKRLGKETDGINELKMSKKKRDVENSEVSEMPSKKKKKSKSSSE
jgi:hypothetical protein